MADENQERLEDYLELERFLTDLQGGQPIRLPESFAPYHIGIYQMALLFHAAIPGASEPRRGFAARLEVQLEEVLHPLSFRYCQLIGRNAAYC